MSSVRGLGAGVAGVQCEGAVHLLTHLAEAAKAGQSRFVERKVSHCGRQERGGIRLGQGMAPDPQAASIALCAQVLGVWPSGPCWALASHSIPCQLPQVSWLIHRSSMSVGKTHPSQASQKPGSYPISLGVPSSGPITAWTSILANATQGVHTAD